MIESTASFATDHPSLSYWIDEGIKLGALALGGLWTYWNYQKSRTYAQKLDLQITGDAFFFRNDLYIDAALVLKNLGASKHILQSEGTSCEIFAILDDLTQREIRLFPVFTLHDQIEPREAVSDHVLWRIQRSVPSDHLAQNQFTGRLRQGRMEHNLDGADREGIHRIASRAPKDSIMRFNNRATATDSMPERIHETRRIELIKKQQAEADNKAAPQQAEKQAASSSR